MDSLNDLIWNDEDKTVEMTKIDSMVTACMVLSSCGVEDEEESGCMPFLMKQCL